MPSLIFTAGSLGILVAKPAWLSGSHVWHFALGAGLALSQDRAAFSLGYQDSWLSVLS